MRARPSRPADFDLSRIARRLGGEVRARLDRSAGYPTHPAVTPSIVAELRRYLSHPNPVVRDLALDALRRRILGRAPSPRDWTAL